VEFYELGKAEPQVAVESLESLHERLPSLNRRSFLVLPRGRERNGFNPPPSERPFSK
jgi:hypothetical protein